MLTQTIGFIGAGQMARALARGFTAAGLVAGDKILAFDPVAAAICGFALEVHGTTKLPKSNAEVVEKSQVIFLAVKPQSMPAVMSELAGKVPADKLIVSIAAGVTLAKLCD